MKKDYKELQSALGYTFQNLEYLQIALTHSSYANEKKHKVFNNERQEFLGDAVLSILVSDYLFHHFRMAEGDLTKLRAAIVCEKALCGFARTLQLGGYLYLGKGEEQMGGRDRPSILADAFEALLAAVYLDGGLEPARRFVIPFAEEILNGNHQEEFRDYKTHLQEIVQKNPEEVLYYILTDESGPDHDKRFEVEVHLNSNVIGRGKGRSKKVAEQNAAKEALELMGQ